MSITTDLSQFGSMEREELIGMLQAWNKHGLPDDFEYDKVTVMFNADSGNVFFTNGYDEVAMLCAGKLESWYTCPYCGHEGFKEDMLHEVKDANCTEYMESLSILEKEEG